MPGKIRWPHPAVPFFLFVFDAVVVFQELAGVESPIYDAPGAGLHSFEVCLGLGSERTRPTERIVAGRILLDLIIFLCLPLQKADVLLHV